MVAVEAGHLGVVETLLKEEGCEVNLQEKVSEH